MADGDTPKTRLMEPPVGPDSAPFWEATRQGTLLVQWCLRCDRGIFYPRAFCPVCGTDATSASVGTGQGLEWRTASGLGTVYSYTVEQNPAATGATFSGGQPYIVALVELAEGVRMLTNVVRCSLDAISVGLAVRLTWEPLSDGRQLPLFMPATDPTAET